MAINSYLSFAILPVSNDSNSKTLTGRTSMNIYSYDRVPYFYIIEHKETGKKYAGAKWAKDANPNNFMLETGYQTSSSTIHKIIGNEGLDAFEIKEIVKLEELCIPFGCQSIDEYESWFLESNDCANSKDWYNRVTPWNAAFGTEVFYSNMINKFGVKYPGQIETHSEKVKLKCQQNFGTDHYYESEECKNKLLEYIHKHDKTATNVWQLEITKEKSRSTCAVNHGVEYPAQSKIIFNKAKETLINNYGVDSPMKSAKIRQTHKKSCMDSLGVDSPMKSDKVVSKYKANFLEKYGVEYPSKVKFFCGQCDKFSTGFSNITRHHKNHKDVVLLLVDDIKVPYTKHMEKYNGN